MESGHKEPVVQSFGDFIVVTLMSWTNSRVADDLVRHVAHFNEKNSPRKMLMVVLHLYIQ